MDIKKIVNKFPTKYSSGFTHEEISDLLEQLNVNEKRFNKAMGTNTVMMIDGNTIYYHTDIESALNQVVNNKSQHPLAWD
jgi:hypothetical protein